MSYRILLVDDEEAIRDNFKKLLEIYGYNVTTACDGNDALDLVAIEKFDLYILDVLMPGMDGVELMQKIKQLDPPAVIIIITGYSSIEGGIRAIRSEAFHYLTKPIAKDELFNVIEKGIKRHDELLNNIFKPIQGLPDDTDNFLDSQMLRGFSQEDVTEFHEMAEVHTYDPGHDIPMQDDPGSIILVENGDVSVWIGETQVAKLHTGESWGEETFVSLSYLFTNLKAETEARIHHYSRKKIIEFLTYKDESLTKRFTINLMTILYLKWKKTIVRISSFIGYENNRI